MARIQWLDAYQLERDVALCIQEQEEHGVYFDLGKARYYISLLEKKKEELYKEIRPFLNYEVIIKEAKDKNGKYPYKAVWKITNKDGTYTKSVLSWYDDPSIVVAPFSRIEIEEPSISKRGLIIQQLLKLGWKPESFTEKGTPQLTIKGEPVDSLEKVGTFGKALSLWYTYNHRQSQIEGFFQYVRSDSRIPAAMNTCATNTFRCAHRIVANIPRPTSIFGKEMRSLFSVREGRKFVGADLSGLELRMLAHHMNDPDYIHQVLEGDIHLYNLSKTGSYITKETVDMSNIKGEKKRLAHFRDIMKTWIYGFLYGSGDAKSGSIIGGTATDGRNLKETFFKELPALGTLIDKVKRFAERHGFLPAIDGRKIRIREFEGRILVHTALNALLQANGSIIAKRAMVICNKEIKRRGLDAFQIIFYHDEFAYDCSEDCSEEVGKLMVWSMQQAGLYYNLNIPIDGEYGIGNDWSIH